MKKAGTKFNCIPEGTEKMPNKNINEGGVQYVGQINQDNQKHGFGTLTNADGSKYIGYWKNNSKSGIGYYDYGAGGRYFGF